MSDVAEALNNLAKDVYADTGGKVPDLVPNTTKLQKLIKFSQQDATGDFYVVPVRLAYPGGFTKALGDGTAGAFALNDAKAGTQKKAKLQPAQTLLRDILSYEDAKKIMSGKQAFVDGVSYFFEGLQKAVRKEVEIDLMYGGTGANMGLATVSSYSSPTITLTTATFAAGIWAGMEGHEVEVMNGASSRGSDTIASIDLAARTVTLTTGVAGTTGSDKVYRKGAYAKQMIGIVGILANATTLFNIDASAYLLWQGTSYAVGSAAFSFSALKKGITKAVNRGLDEDLDLFLNPGAWDDLATDIASLRKSDKTEVSKIEIGTEEIVFHSQNGATKIHSSYFVKEGLGFGLCASDWKRVGACDVTFNDFGEGGSNGKIFFDLPGYAGIEARCYTNQAVVSQRPACSILYTGIVNS